MSGFSRKRRLGRALRGRGNSSCRASEARRNSAAPGAEGLGGSTVGEPDGQGLVEALPIRTKSSEGALCAPVGVSGVSPEALLVSTCSLSCGK